MVLLNGPLWSVWAQTAESGQCGFQGFGKTPVNWQVVSLVSALVSFHDWETGCYRCEVVLHLWVYFTRCGRPHCSGLEMLRGFLSLYLPMRLLHACASACIDSPHWVTFTHMRSSFSWRDTSSPQCRYPWESWLSEWNCASWDNSDLCVLSLVVGKGRQLIFNMFALVLRSLARPKVWMCLWWKTLS